MKLLLVVPEVEKAKTEILAQAGDPEGDNVLKSEGSGTRVKPRQLSSLYSSFQGELASSCDNSFTLSGR